MTRMTESLMKRFDDSSVQFVYASHILEHIEYPREATQFVMECHRILVTGGTLRIVVPGIQKIIEAYVRDDKAFFEVQAKLHPEWCTTKLEHLMYALQQNGKHKYGYGFETIRKLLSMAGFTTVVQSDYDSSTFTELRIDYRDKKDNLGNYLSLYVDAIK